MDMVHVPQGKAKVPHDSGKCPKWYGNVSLGHTEIIDIDMVEVSMHMAQILNIQETSITSN
jgi:hypothetical protein